MNAIRARIANRRDSRARAKALANAMAWAGMVTATVIALPAAGLVGWLLAASLA